MQCGITGFTLVAAYYLFQSDGQKPHPRRPLRSPSGLRRRVRRRPRLQRKQRLRPVDPGPPKSADPTWGRRPLLWEVVFEPADAAFLAAGSDVQVIGSAPGRRLIVIDDPDLKQPRSLKISLERVQDPEPGARDLTPAAGRRTHVELQRVESSHIFQSMGFRCQESGPFPAPPLTLEPPLASSGAGAGDPVPIRARNPGISAPGQDRDRGNRMRRAKRLKTRGAATGSPGPTGSARSGSTQLWTGYKAVEKTLTPFPVNGEPCRFVSNPGIDGRVDGPFRQHRRLAPDPSPDVGGVPGAPGPGTADRSPRWRAA